MTYKFYQSNPEGIDYILTFKSDKNYTQKDWNNICKEVICKYYSNKIKTNSGYIPTSIDNEKIVEYFIDKGFEVKEDDEYVFDFDPFSNGDEKINDLFDIIDKHNKEVEDPWINGQ